MDNYDSIWGGVGLGGGVRGFSHPLPPSAQALCSSTGFCLFSKFTE